MRSSRRTFVNAVLAFAGSLALSEFAAVAQSEPLASWNDGPAKQAIIEFVKVTTAILLKRRIK
jgi:hypothetical protein